VGFGVVAGAAKQEVSAAQQPAPATAEQEVPTPVPKGPFRNYNPNQILYK
jgi:hypothetical protein